MNRVSKLSKLFPLRDIPNKCKSRLRRSHRIQRLLTPFGKELKPRRWIFVIGCYNSGTSLLENILKRHPEIAGLPAEGVMLTDALPYPDEFGWPRMWCECVEDMRSLLESDISEHVRRIKKQWSLWYPHDAQNLLEKSVANATRMPFLQNYFLPACFIYIVRNGYAVAEGIRRKGKPARWKNPIYRDTYPITLCAEQWRTTDEIVQRDRRQLDRFLQIYYEDLTADPPATVKHITDFLGISPISTTKLLDSYKIQQYQGPIRNMNSKSFERLSKSDIKQIREVAHIVLDKHGYSLQG